MESSKIEWTDATFNPWEGCSKVSAGCANCYAETRAERFGTVEWGPNGTRRVASASYWRQPVRWDRLATEGKLPDGRPNPDGHRPRVFCASLADVFEDWRGPMADAKGMHLHVDRNGDPIPDGGLIQGDRGMTMADVRRRLFRLIDDTPNLDWLLLTKRPQNVPGFMPENWLTRVGSPVAGCTWKTEWQDRWAIPKNLWLGTSVENQPTADERIPHLLRVPAAVRFLSCEPLLGPVKLCDLSGWKADDAAHWWGKPILGPAGIGWVIVGGESGRDARPMRPDWARSLRDQCQAAGVAFLFKQWGEYLHAHPNELTRHPGPLVEMDEAGRLHRGYSREPDRLVLQMVGKKAAGRLLDGQEWNEFPAAAR